MISVALGFWMIGWVVCVCVVGLVGWAVGCVVGAQVLVFVFCAGVRGFLL